VSQLRQFFLARCSTISPKHDDSSPYGELAILLAPVLSDYFLVGPDRPTAPEKVELLFGTDGVDIFDTLDRSRRWLLAIDSAAAGQEGQLEKVAVSDRLCRCRSRRSRVRLPYDAVGETSKNQVPR